MCAVSSVRQVQLEALRLFTSSEFSRPYFPPSLRLVFQVLPRDNSAKFCCNFLLAQDTPLSLGGEVCKSRDQEVRKPSPPRHRTCGWQRRPLVCSCPKPTAAAFRLALSLDTGSGITAGRNQPEGPGLLWRVAAVPLRE